VAFGGECMETEGYEIVCVIDKHSLVDSESYQRQYHRPRGKPLEPGFYIVILRDAHAEPRYDTSAEFVGPFESATLARAAMEGPRWLDAISLPSSP